MVEALSIGPLALRILSAPGCARIIARFTRSLHMEADGVVLCCVAPDLGNGPLNFVLQQPVLQHLRALPDSAVLERRAAALHCNGRAMISWSDAERWQPPLRLKNSSSLHHAQALLQSALQIISPPARSFFMTGGDGDDFLMNGARKRIAALARWLATGQGLAPIAPLIGLGRGLTPSGDDLLGGALMALQHWGIADRAAALRHAIGTISDGATTPVSVSLLRAACEGFAHEYIHALFAAMDQADEAAIGLALEKVTSIGHLSGWDTLAGIALVLDTLAMQSGSLGHNNARPDQAA